MNSDVSRAILVRRRRAGSVCPQGGGLVFLGGARVTRATGGLPVEALLPVDFRQSGFRGACSSAGARLLVLVCRGA